MKTPFEIRFPAPGLLLALAGSALGLLTLAGCYEPSRPAHGSVAASAVIGADDYVYYPGSEVYYSPAHRYYYYRDGSAWVHRPEPPRVWVHDAPSVNLHFQDSPERYHRETVKKYPHTWHPSPKDHHDHDDRDDRNEHRP
jgi:hypothetical protein